MAIDAGIVSAYGFAVAHGYTGTPEQFGEDQANFAANAQQVREDKETVEELVESIPPDYTTTVEKVDTVTDVIGNLFSDSEAMGGATGITRASASEYVGTASAFQTFLLNNYTLDENADAYTIAFDIYTEANSSSSGTGLEVQYGNHSSMSELTSFDNDQTDPYHFESFFSVTYAPTVTDRTLGLKFKANSAPNNIWHISNIRLFEGMEIPDAVTAKDTDAREKVDKAVKDLKDLKSSIDALDETVTDIAGESSATVDLSTVQLAGLYDNSGTWLKSNANQDGKVIECLPGHYYSVTANANKNALVSFVTALPSVSGESVSYAGTTSRNIVSAGETVVFEAPSNAAYVWFGTKSYSNDLTPSTVTILKERGRIDEIEKTVFGGNRQNLLIGVWENGGIGDDGQMLPAKREMNFLRTLRTRNYLKVDGFNYTAVEGKTLTVFEYSNTFSFIRKRIVTGNYTLSNDAYYIKLQLFDPDDSNKVEITIEQGGLDSTGLEESSTTRVRTGWLEIDELGFDSIWFIGIAYARIYDENKVILQSGTSYARYNQNKGGYCKISSLLEVLDADPLFAVKDTAKYVRVAFSAENASTTITPQTFDIRFTSGDGAYIGEPSIYVSSYEEVKNTYVDANTMSFMYRLNLANGHQISADDATSSSNLLDNGQYFTSMMLLLPPNYKPIGKPSKLIMWCHGSGDYSLMGYDLMSNNYMDYLGYWQKEGFAIADMFVRTSKYGSMGGDINGMPTNTAAYEQGYKWLIEHFNLDDTGCYVSAKSMGGVGALNILYSSIPLKALDLLAPALNPFYQQCGYGIPSRADYIDDLKLVNADALLEDPSPASPMSTNDFNDLMIANTDKLVGYNCYFSHVVNKTFAELVALKFKNPGAYDDVIKLAKCPVRIHIAVDDTTVAYNQSLNLIKAIKNGNGIAEIRAMPSGCTSPHHAVDNDPDALKVASIVTSLGYTCEDVPLAYAEAASWFKYYA